LQPITTSGENTFGCVINGRTIKYPSFIFSDLLYAWLYDGTDIAIKSSIGLETIYFFKINVDVTSFDPSQIECKNEFDCESFFYSYNNSDTYNAYEGVLEIIHFDAANQIIAGTFWFNGENDKGQTVQVTDGRFDITYELK
jgi:hypothetical protein